MAQTVNIDQDDDRFALVEGVEVVPHGAKNLVDDTEPDISISQEETLVYNAQNELAKMSKPISTSNQGSIMRPSEVLMLKNEDDDIQRYGNGVIQVRDQCSNPNFGSTEEVNGKFSCLAQPIFSDEVHLSKAHYMFDKMPKRDDGDLCDYGEIDLYFGLVDVVYDILGCVSSEKFINTIHFRNTQNLLDKMSELNFKSKSNLSILKAENMEIHSLIQVRTKRPLVLSLTFGSICFCVFIFDPGALFSLMRTVDICTYGNIFGLNNRWITIINYKEILSWGKLIVLMAFWNQLTNVIELPSFQNDVICPWFNGEILGGVVQSYLVGSPNWSVFHVVDIDIDIVSLLLCRSEKSSMLGGILLSKFLVVTFVSIGRILAICEMCVRHSTIILTLEGKGGFEEVGSDNVGLLLWRAIEKKNCERKRQLTANNISRTIGVGYFIFDPGGLNNSLMMNSYVAEVVWVFDPGGLFVVIVLVFDPGGSNNLLGVISGDFKLVYKDATRRPMIVLTLEDKGVLKEWELIHPNLFLQLIYYF
ncbi:hypothetical protein RND81_06G114200 [Saponaria officinalis]